MFSKILFLVLTLTLPKVIKAESCKGCVPLDEYNFDKIISRFKVVIAKFDVAYPYGEKHELYETVASELAKQKDILVTTVGVKDYGEKENQKLADRYGITQSSFPAIRLFVNGNLENPIVFDEDWKLDNLRNFLKVNTDIYIALPGCIEKFDKLAAEFVKASDKEKKLTEIEKAANELNDKEEQNSANKYIKIMKKVIDKGIDFIKQETDRIKKILKEAKVQETKKDQLTLNLNILKSFSARVSKQEL